MISGGTDLILVRFDPQLAEVVEVLRDVPGISFTHFKAKDVVASLSGNSVIVKKITLPVMTQAELSESIYWEAEQYIPFDIQDVALDYEGVEGGTGERQGSGPRAVRRRQGGEGPGLRAGQ